MAIAPPSKVTLTGTRSASAIGRELLVSAPRVTPGLVETTPIALAWLAWVDF